MPRPAGLTDDLLLEFFLAFSRFEYAMKASGWMNPRAEQAEPDWRRLINEAQALDSSLTASILEVGAYLVEAPPKQQTRSDAGLGWLAVKCDDADRKVAFLLSSVKRVRNNLFHGGKFAQLPDLSDRNQRLIKDSLRVLERLLDLPMCEGIREKYHGYAVEQG